MSNLFRNNVVVALGTALSRLTGLARVAVFAIVIGQTALADAYNGANQTPNIVYELLLGGVLSASLVPLFTKQAEERDDGATSAIVTVSVIALTLITAVAVLAAPLIFRLYAINVADEVDAEQYRRVGTVLARIFLVQIFFYGLSAIANALLQARRRFFAAAWSPVLSNLVIIGSLLIVPSVVEGEPALGDVLSDDGLRWVLGLGATVGIAVMAVAVLPALRAADVSIEFRPEFRHPAVRRLTTLSVWTLGYVAANQVALVVVQNLAGPGSGGLDAYVKAYIFFVLPHGLLAMSIVTTFTPEMASAAGRRDHLAFAQRATSGVRLVALLAFPAAAGMLVLHRPLIGLALQHGNFDADDAVLTGRALAGFALGLVGFSVYLFVLRAFYAYEDARTPFVLNVAENAINVVLAVALVGRWDVLGLGAAFAIAYTVSAAWSLQVLGYKVRHFDAGAAVRGLWPMALAALVMTEAMWVVTHVVGGVAGVAALGRVAAAGAVGIAVYVGVLALLGAPEIAQLRRRTMARFA